MGSIYNKWFVENTDEKYGWVQYIHTGLLRILMSNMDGYNT